MKTIALCALTCVIALIPFASQANEYETNYAAFLEGRAAVLGPMSAIVDSLDTEGLLFDRPIDRGLHGVWVKRMSGAIERTLNAAAEYRAEPTLYHATRFEDAWQRLSGPFERTPEVLLVLYAYGQAGPEEISSPHDAREPEEHSAGNQVVCDAVRAQLSSIHAALSRVKVEYGFAYVQYVRAASDDLQRND